MFYLWLSDSYIFLTKSSLFPCIYSVFLFLEITLYFY